ncbi:MAG TPA: ABC transporter permease [Candidatus Sulfotelmatobacter sp.]|nr:ABC transporter permease [Candidatus Sulfotelmatobacter sp.]
MRPARWLKKLSFWLRLLLHRRELDQELDDEIAYHLEAKIEDNVEKGMVPEEARRAARIELGGVEQVRENMRAVRPGAWLETFVRGIRFGLRRLRKSPGFTAVTILTLAVGVGANVAVFSVVEGVLLKPLPYPKPEQLVGVWQGILTQSRVPLGPSNYFVYREQSRAFQDVGLYEDDSVSVTGIGEPEQVRALDVTQGVLPILGIPPMFGRWFSQQEDSPGSPATVVLGYGFWQRKFGGDPDVIGRPITLDGKLSQIIGVMPKRFHFLAEQDAAVILPLQLERNHSYLGQFHYDGIGRLRPGITIADADADLSRLLPIVLRSFPPPPGYSVDLFEKLHPRPDLRPLKQDVVGDVSNLLWVLMGGIGMVLLIACANVANLLLVRTEGRQQELAIRSALGGARTRIALELLLESFVIGVIGSALGLGFAYGALRVVVTMAPSNLPRVGEIGIDGHVLLFTLALTLLVTLLFGSVPVFRYAGSRFEAGLREAGRSLSQSRERHRSRKTLVTVQVAFAFVLLISSGLMIRSFAALIRVNPGFFAPAQLQTFRIAISEEDIPDPTAAVRASQGILEKIAVIPGVSSVAFASSIPMAGGEYQDPIWTADSQRPAGEVPPVRTFVFVSPEYFGTMGIPIIGGRNLRWTDTYNRIPVALVSDKIAREYWHDPASAIGKRVRASSTDDWREIVGVVGNVRMDGMNQPTCSCLYFPLSVANFDGNPLRVARDVVFVVRSPFAGSQGLINQIRRAVWSVDAKLPLDNVHTEEYFYDRSMARTSFTLVMLGIAGGMALLLSIVGLYGVVAYSVSQRTREIGVRIALGAQPRELKQMFIRQGLLLIGTGVAIGMIVSFAVIRLMSSLLFGVSPNDPATFIGVSVLLFATALFASWIPARRALRVDPMVALRYE